MCGEGHKQTVLVVDDEEALRRALQRELAEFEVIGCGSFLEAVDYLSPDLGAVVSDCNMGPGPGGVQLLEEAKHRAPNARRVLVTGGMSDDEASQLISSGLAHRVIHKPHDFGQVRAALVDALEKAATSD